MNMSLQPNQLEALNLVYYSIYQGKSFSNFQRLFDDEILSSNHDWYEWIFILKAKLNQNCGKDFFGSSNEVQSEVNNRLYSLILADGMTSVYKTPAGKPIIERSIYFF